MGCPSPASSNKFGAVRKPQRHRTCLLCDARSFRSALFHTASQKTSLGANLVTHHYCTMHTAVTLLSLVPIFCCRLAGEGWRKLWQAAAAQDLQGREAAVWLRTGGSDGTAFHLVRYPCLAQCSRTPMCLPCTPCPPTTRLCTPCSHNHMCASPIYATYPLLSTLFHKGSAHSAPTLPSTLPLCPSPQYVAAKLGQEFTEPPPWTLDDVFSDTTSRTPVIFILSTGADPTAMLQVSQGHTFLFMLSLGHTCCLYVLWLYLESYCGCCMCMTWWP